MTKYGTAVTIGMYGLGQSLVCQNTLACTVVNYLVDFMNTSDRTRGQSHHTLTCTVVNYLADFVHTSEGTLGQS